MQRAYAILSRGVPGSTVFSTLSHKGMILEKKVTEHKSVF